MKKKKFRLAASLMTFLPLLVSNTFGTGTTIKSTVFPGNVNQVCETISKGNGEFEARSDRNNDLAATVDYQYEVLSMDDSVLYNPMIHARAVNVRVTIIPKNNVLYHGDWLNWHEYRGNPACTYLTLDYSFQGSQPADYAGQFDQNYNIFDTVFYYDLDSRLAYATTDSAVKKFLYGDRSDYDDLTESAKSSRYYQKLNLPGTIVYTETQFSNNNKRVSWDFNLLDDRSKSENESKRLTLANLQANGYDSLTLYSTFTFKSQSYPDILNMLLLSKFEIGCSANGGYVCQSFIQQNVSIKLTK